MFSSTRFFDSGDIQVAAGWSVQALTPGSRLFGANGLRTGPDGRIYVAQVSGSQISAVHADTGVVQTVSPMGGAIVAPDDLVFDEAGNLFATEISEGRVSMRAPDGRTRVVYGDLPCANPITLYQGRLFAGECRPHGRIMELYPDGRAPRLLADNLPMPNAMEVGPDGWLYFPVMEANAIWRVRLEGGQPEVVAENLGVPDAVKFDQQGRIVSTQAATGEVLRIDPRTGARESLAQLAPGLDNLTFVGERLFVSSFSGQITELLGSGKTQALLPPGFNGPLGIAMADADAVIVADGPYTYFLTPGQAPDVAGMLFTPGSPGYVRGIARVNDGEYVVTTGMGQVQRWWPQQQRCELISDGYEMLFGVAVQGDGVWFVDAEQGALYGGSAGAITRLGDGLDFPKDIALDCKGDCFVTEEGAGRVVKRVAGGWEPILEDLQQPQGLAISGRYLYVVEVGRRRLLQLDLECGECVTIASHLPVGPAGGVLPKPIGPFPPLSGAMGPFAGITAAADGTMYLSADGVGAVLSFSPAPH